MKKAGIHQVFTIREYADSGCECPARPDCFADWYCRSAHEDSILLFLRATSLTRDEAGLALSFVDTGFFELLKPLRWDQAAPIGFLLAEKAVMDVFGSSELSFRLFSLVTSILIIPLFYLLVRDVLSPVGVLVGLAIITLSEPLIYWGTLFKQYSFDVLIALVLLNLGRLVL